jgi:hypothetical protein
MIVDARTKVSENEATGSEALSHLIVFTLITIAAR